MSFPQRYARMGLVVEGKKPKPFLAPKRKPKGEEAMKVEAGVWYRTPLFDDSHLSLDGVTALCGRGLDVDDMWWLDSGWEEALGPYYLVVEARKDGQCSACKKELKAQEAQAAMPRGKAAVTVKAPSPFRAAEDTAMAKLIARQNRMKLDAMAAYFISLWPEAEVDNELD